jgi:hypothetical protein
LGQWQPSRCGLLSPPSAPCGKRAT